MAVGKNAHEAISALKTQGQIHALRSSGVTVEQDASQISSPDRPALAEAFNDYMAILRRGWFMDASRGR